ncbi:MAG: DUF362 domain-containing protein [candidate division Zixibacteria bacterium]|nr:DUF362 domain-containing protein [candidate division Zixibacteria bacterium]MBU1469758.1 DUF362 domain-containing protein [candidate division Zixibacteria bacterium]MBU2624966.1 DUF362 domain-containing protein [candidate division Zixibacteria bacterium]
MTSENGDIDTTHRVGLAIDSSARYNTEPPYHPTQRYSEYSYDKTARGDFIDGYDLVRDALFQLGLDRPNYGTAAWNPLGDIISPGDRVALKPNWVLDKHPRNKDIFSVVTHPSIIRAVLDYAMIALQGKGSVTVCDAPQGDCDFDRLRELSHLDAIRDFYVAQGGIVPKFVDLRKIRYLVDDDGYLMDNAREQLQGDPERYCEVNLGADSLLSNLDNLQNLYGADYDRNFTNNHHRDDRHEYLISRTILTSDVVISIPKMKTHKKTGVTLNLKNLVGINGDKNYLAHFRVGASDAGGDECPSTMERKKKLVLKSQRFMIDKLLVRPNRLSVALFSIISKSYRGMRRITRIDSSPDIRSGDWYGNDTAWRMVVDLNRILFLADSDGAMKTEPQRRYLSIVDGVIAGEGDGPLDPDPVHAGYILTGTSPTSVDLVGTALMGFDASRLHLYDYIVGDHARRQPLPFGIADTDSITIGFEAEDLSFDQLQEAIRPRSFRPHHGWTGHIELPKVDETFAKVSDTSS